MNQLFYNIADGNIHQNPREKISSEAIFLSYQRALLNYGTRLSILNSIARLC